MKKIIAVLITLMGEILCSGICQGAPPPMVEKHIFLAKPPSTEEATTVQDTRPVMARLNFTGVMITDQGRYALIEPKIHKRGEEKKKIFTIGETVAGYTVEKIENNYIVLGQKSKNIKLNLYGSDKKRPPPPVEETPAPAVTAQKSTQDSKKGKASTSKENDKNTAATAQKSGQKGASGSSASATATATATATKAASKNKSENSLSNALKSAVEKTKQGNATQTQISNPFLEAIKKAKENASQ